MSDSEENTYVAVEVDNKMIKNLDRIFEYEDVEGIPHMTGVKWSVNHAEGTGTCYGFKGGIADKIHIGKGNYADPYDCKFKLHSYKARKHLSSYLLFKDILTVGCLVQEWGDKDFTSIVTNVQDTTFSWIRSSVGDSYKIVLGDVASTSGIGNIKKIMIGNLKWEPFITSKEAFEKVMEK